MAEELAGGGVDDADVEVGDEQEDVGSGVGPADADVVETAVVAERDRAGLVDAVATDAQISVGARFAGGGFGAALVGGGGGGATGVSGVGAVVVVAVAERAKLALELGEVGGGGLVGEPLLHGGVEPLDFAAGGRVVGSRVLLDDALFAQLLLEAVEASSASAGEPGRVDESVVGER